MTFKMNRSKGQTQEQQLATRIINHLKIWARWSPDLYTGVDRLAFTLSINDKLEINPIIQKLELDGKDGAAKRIEQLRNIVFEGLRTDLDLAKHYIEYKGHKVLVASDKTKRDALRLVEILERAIPYLGSPQVKERVQVGLAITKLNDLTDTESNIVEALSKDVMTGEKLAEKAGYPYNSNFKNTLSSLRKREILGNKAPGYFLEPTYHFLISKSDRSQDKRQD